MSYFEPNSTIDKPLLGLTLVETPNMVLDLSETPISVFKITKLLAKKRGRHSLEIRYTPQVCDCCECFKLTVFLSSLIRVYAV